MKNKKSLSFLLALVLVLFFVNKVESRDGDSVPWDTTSFTSGEPKDLMPEKPKSTLDTLREWWSGPKPKTMAEDKPFSSGRTFGDTPTNGKDPQFETAGDFSGGIDDVHVNAAQKAALLRSNRGFTFFKKPVLKDEKLTEKQELLLKKLISKCEGDPQCELAPADMDGLSSQEIQLVEKIFNTAKEQAARDKKDAQLKIAQFKKQELSKLSKVEAQIFKKLVAAENKPTLTQKGVDAYKQQMQSYIKAAQDLILDVANDQYHQSLIARMAKNYLLNLGKVYKEDPAALKIIEILKKNPQLADAVFDKEALALARYSKDAQEDADLSRAEKNIVRGVLDGDDTNGTLLIDLGVDGYKQRVNDVITAVKLMKTTLAMLKEKVLPGHSPKEEQVTVAELQTAFEKAVNALPDSPNKVMLQKVGEKIINIFQEGPSHWAVFRTSAGLHVDYAKV